MNMKRTIVGLMLLVVMPLAGCAVKQQSWGDPETGLTLTYRLPEDQILRYRTTVEQEHSMKAMGQPRKFEAEKSFEVSMKSEARDEGGHQLTVTVDSLHWRLDTPRGELERDIPKIFGKSFGMVLSPTGDETDFSETQEVAYEMQPAGWMNVSDDFKAFFPNLPEEPVKIGDRWTTTEYIKDMAFNSSQKIVLDSIHTLTGVETIDGMECAKISTVMHGMLEELGERMTRTPEMTGRFEGTGTWHVAYEEGLLVRTSMTLRGTGEMISSEYQGMPRPMAQVMTIDSRLLP
jgi:hypothetical protein